MDGDAAATEESILSLDNGDIPGAKVALLPGVGHSPMLEDPPRTAGPILAFTAIHAAQGD